jgi:hypothetical protein
MRHNHLSHLYKNQVPVRKEITLDQIHYKSIFDNPVKAISLKNKIDYQFHSFLAPF